MIFLHVNLAFRGKQVKRRELQIVDGLNRPTVMTIGIHVEVGGIKTLLRTLEKNEGIAIRRRQVLQRCDCL